MDSPRLSRRTPTEKTGPAPSPRGVPWPSSPSACSATRCCARRPQPVTDFDKELRTLVKDLDRDDAGRARRRPRRARRSASACASSPTTSTTTLGHLVNPMPRPVRRASRTARRAACRSPGSPSTPPRALRVVAKGFEHARRAGRPRGQRAAGPLHPARDRPPRRRPVHRPARHGPSASSRMKAIREAEWAGGSHADGQGQPARDLRPGAVARVRLVFAGTPATSPSRRSRRCSTRPGTRWSPWSPGPTRPPGAAGARAPVAGRRAGPTRPASRCCSRRRPREPEFLDRLRALAPGLLPGRRVRRAGARRPRSTSRGTAGSTCTSRCCPPGAAPRRCSTPSWPATR